MITDNIQKNQSFIDYQFKALSFPGFVAFLPLLYLIPTVYVTANIAWYYFRKVLNQRDETVNPQVFLIIMLHQFSSFCYMLSDYANIRLPATGLFTSWCASNDPNHYLKVVFCLSLYFNYVTMPFPLLLAVMRLLPIYYPTRHTRISKNVIRFVIPLIFLYPFFFFFFMYPALGVCRQYPEPYDFGAIYIHFDGSWHNIKSYPFLLANATLWFILAIIANFLLYSKLRALKPKTVNVRLRKAELSLTVTTVAMFFSYITNTAFLFLFGFFPPLSAYFVAFRPFGNDCETVIVPWVFFLVHPAFRNKSKSLRNFAFAVRISVIRSVAS